MYEGNLGRKPYVSRVLLDMDGVLCDWVGGVCKLYGRSRAEYAEAWHPKISLRTWLGVTDAQLWQRIDQEGAAFWENLDAYPWAYDLWVMCNKYAPTKICTTPGRFPTTADSRAGKQRWLERELGCGQGFHDAIMCFDKEDLAAPDVVLIDDRQLVLKPFAAKGGMTIQFPNDFEERAHQVPYALKVVTAELANYCQFGELR